MKPQTGLDHSVERKYTANALPCGRAFHYEEDNVWIYFSNVPLHLNSFSLSNIILPLVEKENHALLS